MLHFFDVHAALRGSNQSDRAAASVEQEGDVQLLSKEGLFNKKNLVDLASRLPGLRSYKRLS